MGRTSFFSKHKSEVPKINSHLIAEKPPPGQRTQQLSKAQRILGTSGDINIDSVGGDNEWHNYRMAHAQVASNGGHNGGERRREPSPSRTESKGSYTYNDMGEREQVRDGESMHEVRQQRSRTEEYHNELRASRSIEQGWNGDNISELLQPSRHGLGARASSTLLGRSYIDGVREEKSSSTLRSYYDRAKTSGLGNHPIPSSTGQLRKLTSPSQNTLPRSPLTDVSNTDHETLAAAETRAKHLREQMGHGGRMPMKKASRLNISRLFGKDKEKMARTPDFVMHDPRSQHGVGQHTNKHERVMGPEITPDPNDGNWPKRHTGVHDLYEHYEDRAFRNAVPSISESELEGEHETDKAGHHQEQYEEQREMDEHEISPKQRHIDAQVQRQASFITSPTPMTSSQRHADEQDPSDNFQFPDPNATARQKSKKAPAAVTSIFPTPHSPSFSAFPLPNHQQMRRLSGTPPSAPPDRMPPPPPKTTKGDGGINAGVQSPGFKPGYAQRHWDNGSTHSSATGVSHTSKKSIFSSATPHQHSILSLSSDSESDHDGRPSQDSSARPQTSVGQKSEGRREEKIKHDRKRSSTISALSGQMGQDEKFLTIPLPSPISHRLSGPWQPPVLTPREKERDSGSTIRGGRELSMADKRLSSSTTSTQHSIQSTSSMRSANSGVSRSNTLHSVAESENEPVVDYNTPPTWASTLDSKSYQPEPAAQHRTRTGSTDRAAQHKTRKAGADPSSRHLTRDAPKSTRSESRTEARAESRTESRTQHHHQPQTPTHVEPQHTALQSSRKDGTDAGRAITTMQVTPQEQALLSALRNKRARMRDEILAEAEAKEEEDMWGNEFGGGGTGTSGGIGGGIGGDDALVFEFPAPPKLTPEDLGRRGSAASVVTHRSQGGNGNGRKRSESRQGGGSGVSRNDSLISQTQPRNKYRESTAPSIAPSKAESMADSIFVYPNARRESLNIGHSLSPAPRRRPLPAGHEHHRQVSHAREESDTLDGVAAPPQSSRSSRSLTPNPAHPKAMEKRGNLVDALHHQTTTANESSRVTLELAGFLNFSDDEETPRSSWDNTAHSANSQHDGDKENQNQMLRVDNGGEKEKERRKMARLSAVGAPVKSWDAPLTLAVGKTRETMGEREKTDMQELKEESSDFDDSEGEAILREWGRGTLI